MKTWIVQLCYRVFSPLSWFILEMNTRSWHQRVQQKNVTCITQNFSFHSTCLYIQELDREKTANSNLTKGCLIWFTMFVVESFYNRKIRFVNIRISGKGMIWKSCLTRYVSISIKSMPTKALLVIVHYDV